MARHYKKKKIFFIISAVIEALSLSNEPQQLLDMVLETLFGILRIDCCWIQLLTLESRKPWLASYRGFTPDMEREIGSMEMGQRLGHQVAGLGHNIAIPDLSRHREYGLSSFSKAGLRSLVAVPLRTYHMLGVIGIASRAKKQFSMEVTELLTVIASAVGVALDKADLYQRALAREKAKKEAEEEWPMGKAEKAAKQIPEQTRPSEVDVFELQSRRPGVPGGTQVMDKIKVFVIDDQGLFRQGLHRLLSQTDDIEVVGESGFLEETVAIIGELAPNSALIDINLPSLSGLGLAQRVSQRSPGISVIILTSYEDDSQIFEALKAGVAGYLCKDIAPEGLATAVRRVFKGERIIGELLVRPRVAQQVLKQLQDMEKEGLTKPLSPHEMKMLGYFVNGYSCKQVTHAMGVSEQKIRNAMASIVSRLVANRGT